ncbi:hypothetical protein [Desulfovibrio gilichinskyi]|uniref:Uncharacterized protein n=1 Tax=Desulfovibrio gilichinskyi TaxID=1519643 RepID=A0A1X7C3G1_9BACT|nr:hypothetical protein [Desulfovibrio gilichinskyi]SME89327.1 hypothetical protein SAMN06295933_0276 [Desulfovibrio gilichinskyi]
MNTQPDLFAIAGYTPPPKPETQVDRCKKCKHGLVDPDIAYCQKHDLALEVEGGDMIMANGGFAIECYGKDWREVRCH